jgi:hypothetical protein
MPCGVWAAVSDLCDNTGPAWGKARRPADYKVLGGPSAALHNVTSKMTLI